MFRSGEGANVRCTNRSRARAHTARSPVRDGLLPRTSERGQRREALKLLAVRSRPPLAAWPYLLVCTGIGLLLGWVPAQLHGPIPHKFDVLFIEGRIAVWGWYVARSSIGFWI